MCVFCIFHNDLQDGQRRRPHISVKQYQAPLSWSSVWKAKTSPVERCTHAIQMKCSVKIRILISYVYEKTFEFQKENTMKTSKKVQTLCGSSISPKDMFKKVVHFCMQILSMSNCRIPT